MPLDADVALRLILFGACLVWSGFFSGSETALFSLGRVERAKLREENHPRFGLIERLLSEPRRLIATIFIGNELVNIAASTLMASITHRYAHGLGDVAVVVISTLITVPVILFFGEITTKNIAQHVRVGWATRAARPLEFLARVIAPLRLLIERIGDLTVQLVSGKSRRTLPPVSVGEVEFRGLIDVARREGQIDPGERQLIHRVFEFGDRMVGQVMTPADKIFSLTVSLPTTRIVEEVRASVYSRIPVFEQDRRHVIGVLYAKQLLAASRGLGAGVRIRDLLHEPLFVPRQARCDAMMRTFLKRHVHMALVVNEYGHVIGLVTLEDLLEEVFGEIVDEKEREGRGGE